MSETDNVFTEPKNVNNPFDKDDWKTKKNEEKQNAYSMIEETVASFSDIEKFNKYLDVQARFDKYSVNNAVLISAQRPDATRLLDGNAWGEKDAYIKKGEKGIVILEPGKEYRKEDGKSGTYFVTKKVFDISQTNAERKEASARPVDEKRLVKSLVMTSPVPVYIDDGIPANVGAAYKPEQKCIRVRNGMPGADIFRFTAREIFVAKLSTAGKEVNPERVYSMTYIVCRRAGIEPPKYDSPVKPFSGKDIKTIKSELNVIRTETNAVKEAMTAEKTAKSRDDEAR